MYPPAGSARDSFILVRRGPRQPVHPWRFQDLIVEDELGDDGVVARVATVFLTGKECPWRCVMCDLWRKTTAADTPAGAIPQQIESARRELARRGQAVAQIKLYNASNFFDRHAVPDRDYPAIAQQLRGLDRVIVEAHPALIGEPAIRFEETLRAACGRSVRLEVAMGLETANPSALASLNKGLTCAQFEVAADTLQRLDIAFRAFVLISPPFISTGEQDRWLAESVDLSFHCGATAVSLIPTRDGNGAMEALASQHLFRAPSLDDIERSMDLVLRSKPERRRIFVDLWDLERFACCSHCVVARRERLQIMNLTQQPRAHVACAHCGHGAAA